MFKVKKKEPQPNIQHTIRFDEELHQKISELAEQEEVSFNHFVLECCRYALDEYEPEKRNEKDEKRK